jgi:predicted membrane-bound mannosyltransferase
MNTSTIVWIVVAVVVAVVLIAAIGVLARRQRDRRRLREAEQIRAQARDDTANVERREALAEETAARARAAQAEADVKAAEAARLHDRVAAHRSDASSARDELNAQFERADRLDPRSRKAQGREQQTDEEAGSAPAADRADQTPESSNAQRG